MRIALKWLDDSSTMNLKANNFPFNDYARTTKPLYLILKISTVMFNSFCLSQSKLICSPLDETGDSQRVCVLYNILIFTQISLQKKNTGIKVSTVM